jgi:hypothetical protein
MAALRVCASHGDQEISWRSRDHGDQGIMEIKGSWRSRDHGDQGIMEIEWER